MADDGCLSSQKKVPSGEAMKSNKVAVAEKTFLNFAGKLTTTPFESSSVMGNARPERRRNAQGAWHFVTEINDGRQVKCDSFDIHSTTCVETGV